MTINWSLLANLGKNFNDAYDSGLKERQEQEGGDLLARLVGPNGATAPANAPPAALQSLSSLGQPNVASATGGAPNDGERPDVATLKSALGPMESGGRYDATGPAHSRMGVPLGKYQIMSANLPQWSQEAVGRVVSPQEFLSNPELQEKIAGAQMGKILDKYGSLQDAASVWHSGRPLAQATAAGARDVNMSTADYVAKTVGRSATPSAPVQVAAAQSPADLPIAEGQEAAGYFAVPNPGQDPQIIQNGAQPPPQGAPGVQTAQAPSRTMTDAGAAPARSQPQRISTDMLQQLVRNPTTRAAGLRLWQAQQKGADLRHLDLGNSIGIFDSNFNRIGTIPKDKDDTSIQTLITPEDRAKYGVPADYRGAVQVDKDGKLSFPGKPATEVNVNQTAEKAQDSKIGGAYGDTFIDMQKSGRSAQGQLNTFKIMEKLIDNPNFYSGNGAQLMTTFKRAAASLGVTGADGAAPNEVFQKLASQSVLDKLGGSLGSGVSNSDVAFMSGTTANLGNTPEGNRQVIQFGKALAQREVDVARLARDYAKKNNGRLDAGFDDELARFAEANPLIPEATKIQAQRAAQSAPQPAPSAAAPQMPDRSALEAEARRRGLIR